MLWLLLAIAPIPLIILVVDLNRGEVSGIAPLVIFGLNPIVSIFACYKLFNQPGRDKIGTIVGAIVLGLVIAAINAMVGFFGGCVCGGHLDLK